MEPLVGTETNIPSSDATELEVSGTKKRGLNKAALFAVVFLLVLLVLIILGGLPKFFRNQALVSETRTEVKAAPSVAVTTAKPGATDEEFTLPGSTQAIQDAPIYARVNGYLQKRYVNIGDHVKQGQLLADIETPEIDQQVEAERSSLEQATANVENSRQALAKSESDFLTAKANVQKALTDLQFYTAEVKRYSGLAQQGAVSYEERDTRVQQYNAGVAVLESLRQAERSAQSTINSARAAVHVAIAAKNAESARLHQLEATQSFKRVVAPFEGIVVKRLVDAGALITAGSAQGNTTLFEVAKTDVLRVFVYVPEQYVPYIKEGEEARLQFQEYPGKNFVGLVSNVAGGLDPDSKTLQVEIHVSNPDHKLMPGEYCQVAFEAPSTIRLPIIPATTVQVRPDGAFIYALDAANHVHTRKITIGRDLGGQFEVSNGVTAGETIVVNPSDELREDMPVVPVMQQKPAQGKQ